MPSCPVCRDEFEDDVEVCPTDGVALVEASAIPAPVAADQPLGVFHPVIALVVIAVAARRDVPVRPIEIDHERVELRVPAEARDPLRAELAVHWTSVVMAVPEEHVAAVRTVGDRLVGWHDAPGGAWVDGDGRIRVEAGADEEATVDAARRVGPALSIAGVLGLLLAWLGDGGELLWLTAGAAIVLGLLLPL